MSTMTFDNSETNLVYKKDRVTKKYQSDDLGLCKCLGPALLISIVMWVFIIVALIS